MAIPNFQSEMLPLVKILCDGQERTMRDVTTTTASLATEPDWLHEDNKVAVYLDGMSRGLHGDPKTAQRDQLIRGDA
jgi:hypothetical protein